MISIYNERNRGYHQYFYDEEPLYLFGKEQLHDKILQQVYQLKEYGKIESWDVHYILHYLQEYDNFFQLGDYYHSLHFSINYWWYNEYYRN